MVPTGARKLTRAPAEKARAQPFSTAPWITGRARGGERGGRLFPQRARRPFVPNKGDEARQCRKKEPRTVLGRGSLDPARVPSGVGCESSRRRTEPEPRVTA